MFAKLTDTHSGLMAALGLGSQRRGTNGDAADRVPDHPPGPAAGRTR
jgi:hypothetical protein